MRRQHYSTLMSADFTIGRHFSVSAFWKAASTAGVPPFCRPLVVSGLMPE